MKTVPAMRLEKKTAHFLDVAIGILPESVCLAGEDITVAKCIALPTDGDSVRFNPIADCSPHR